MHPLLMLYRDSVTNGYVLGFGIYTHCKVNGVMGSVTNTMSSITVPLYLKEEAPGTSKSLQIRY
jgi:hypothetical protein